VTSDPALSGERRAVAGVIERPRLATLLDSRWPQVCVLRAASGAGKTTLLRSWAVTRTDTTPMLWVTISSEVASAGSFWTRLIDTAHRSGAVSVETSAALAEQVTRSVDPVRVAIEFLADAGPVIIVLDAYEKVGGAIEQIDQDLLRLTEALPEVRVIVAARGRTTLAEDGLLLRSRVQLISDDELAFTADEAAALLWVHLNRDDPSLAASAVQATSGYALGLRALVLAMTRRASIPSVGSDEWRQLVATDLRTALPDEDTARFLAVTSVPPYFDVALAARITGRDDVEELLAGLERQGFGRWIPYARAHPVFQYVDSIREAFASEFRRGHQDTYEKIGSAAAQWLFVLGDHDMAFDLALEARDYALAVRIYVDLLRVNPECYLTVRLIGPLSAIPLPELRRHPMLAFALGLARLTHPILRAAAPEAFALSVSGTSRGEIVSPELDGFINKSVRAVSLRLLGRFAAAAQSSRAAIAEVDGLSPERQEQLSELIAMILRQLSYNLLQGGSYDAAIATMNRSAALTKVSSTRNCALAYATGTHAYVGDLAAARAARAQIDPHGWPLEAELSYLNALTVIGEGFLDLDALDFQAALDRITGAEPFTDTTEFWGFFTLVAVHAQLGLGQGLAAARHVEARLGAVVPPHGLGDNTVTRALLNVQAIGWLTGGRIAKAERVLASVPPRAPEVVSARLLHLVLTERSPAVVERLPRWLALPRHTIRTRAAALTLGAVAAARAGDERLALSLAARAHDLHVEHGVRAHLIFLPAEDRRRLGELAARNGHPEIAGPLLGTALDVIPPVVPPVVLGDKELAVLAELVGTGSREQIAIRLGVSPNTVKSQLRSIYRKLGVSSRTAAISVATEYELLEHHTGHTDDSGDTP
jgi:LuxR family maltose regulon positive regulatory protein